MDKLNALAARAMGWTLDARLSLKEYEWQYMNGDKWVGRSYIQWRPSTCADDALTLLEKMAGHKIISIHRTGDDESRPWECAIEVFDEQEFLGTKAESHAFGATPHLAVTICALRAANIPESEITAAME